MVNPSEEIKISARKHSDDEMDAGAWRRDPFWYQKGSTDQLNKTKQIDDIRLEAIVMRNGKGYAIVNGRVVGVGDRIQGAVIAWITGDSLLMKSKDGAKVIRIDKFDGNKEM
jgi:hypothetical protein